MAQNRNSTVQNTTRTTQQTFHMTAPGAMSVLLAGDFTHWQENAIPMKKESGDIWKATVALPRGTHHYRFIVDGQWHNDPECTVRVANPYGSEDSVRNVS